MVLGLTTDFLLAIFPDPVFFFFILFLPIFNGRHLVCIDLNTLVFSNKMGNMYRASFYTVRILETEAGGRAETRLRDRATLGGESEL